MSYSIMMDGHQEISDWPFAFHFLQKTQQLAIRPDTWPENRLEDDGDDEEQYA